MLAVDTVHFKLCFGLSIGFQKYFFVILLKQKKKIQIQKKNRTFII